MKFGDSSLDFELVVWLTAEATKRPGVVKAAYMWALDTALCKYAIQIPFPQRDLNLRSVFGLEKEEALALFPTAPVPPARPVARVGSEARLAATPAAARTSGGDDAAQVLGERERAHLAKNDAMEEV